MKRIKVIFVQDINVDIKKHLSLSEEEGKELIELYDFQGNLKESILLPSFAVQDKIPNLIVGTQGLDTLEDHLILGAIVAKHIEVIRS